MRKILILAGALVLAGPLAFAQNPCSTGQSLYTLLGVSCVYQDRIFSNFVVTSDPDTFVILGDQITVIFGGNPFSPSITFVYDDGPSLQIERRNQRRNSGSSSDVATVVDLVSVATGQQNMPRFGTQSSGSSTSSASARSSGSGSSSGNSSGPTQTAGANPGWFAPVPIQFDIPSLVSSPGTSGGSGSDLTNDSNLIGFTDGLTESPEPATMLLIGMGLSGLALLRRRNTR